MSALTDFKVVIQPGAVLEVTNHYITQPDHPKYGTTRRTVVKTNSASFYTDADPWPNQWPKSLEIVRDDAGAWHIAYPGKPGVRFLSIKVIEP